jgi:hypothetical protein
MKVRLTSSVDGFFKHDIRSPIAAMAAEVVGQAAEETHDKLGLIAGHIKVHALFMTLASSQMYQAGMTIGEYVNTVGNKVEQVD